ncbi:extracellular serine-threonine rich protein [Colletotrichum karsti]|uniref:Extracellular serine-threonine rich protein n=1 Tax=Colletotrichum karsti TaxID=1095194 RepID=A0A9P6I1V6_9PEZI|nr:extracellular serine-threonine rich protein [Colletotrichum karsti]KAF9874509.1 extracellular serine-threonine rich protein [Colletotrichum karsti]
MKSTVAAVGLMASLASATAYQPRHFHWRRDNSTASAAPGFTTLTVEVTEVATVTSCAPTITNCPARSGTLSASDLITQVVTNVVHLTETVCPVTEAESISKSLVQEHSTGNLPGSTRTAPAVSATPSAPGVPLTTGGGVPVPGVPSQTNSAQDPTVTSPPATGGDNEDEDDDCPADGEVETSVTEIVSTKIVTMTIGKGSTASVITTAVPTTAVSTVLVPKPTTDGAVKPSASVPAGGSVTGAIGSEEPTTTTTATSTGTRTVTIKRPNATGTPGSDSDSDKSTGNGNGSDGECSCPAVTVTVPASTVYVTIGGASSTPTAAAGNGNSNGSGSGSGSGNGASEPSKTASAQQPATTEAADEGEDDECPADEEEVVTLSTTVTVAPFPTNGTGAGSAKPTGAAYRRSNKLF